MKLVYESRACSVLFNILRSQPKTRPLLLPSNICPIVPITLLKAGWKFSLVDISATDLFINADECLQIVSKSPERYGGIIFVRTYGAEVDPTNFFAELKLLQPSLLIIDDKCLCRPDYDGSNLASFADVTLFSTSLSKYVDLGFGGFAFLRNTVPYQRHARKFTQTSLSKMTERCKDKVAEDNPYKGAKGDWLDLREPRLIWRSYRKLLRDSAQGIEQHKQKINQIYSYGCPSKIQLSESFQQWRFNILVPNADHLVRRLSQAKLFASRHFSPLRDIGGERRFPCAEKLHRSIINLPNDRHSNESKARQTIEIVLKHLQCSRKRPC